MDHNGRGGGGVIRVREAFRSPREAAGGGRASSPMRNNALNAPAGVRLGLLDMLVLLVGALTASKNCRRLWNNQPPPHTYTLPVTEEFCFLWGGVKVGWTGLRRITATNCLIIVSNYCFI